MAGPKDSVDTTLIIEGRRAAKPTARTTGVDDGPALVSKGAKDKVNTSSSKPGMLFVAPSFWFHADNNNSIEAYER